MKDKRDMVKAAYYYYEKNLTQQEIADRMNTSRQRINRILKKALKEGIVKIEVVDIEEYNVELEHKLEEKYNLKQSVVISNMNNAKVETLLGKAASKYLESILEKEDLIGVTGGRALSEVSKQLKENVSLNVSTVQLIGGSNVVATDLKSDEIASKIASKLGGESNVLYAPVIVENKEVKDALMSDGNMKHIFSKMDKCNVIIAGIGELTLETPIHLDQNFNKEYTRNLIDLGCVGDIGFRWYNLEGEFIKHDYDDRTIGYNILTNKTEALKIGIAGGESKINSIKGALNGRFLDVLITDEATALELIK